MLKTFEPSLLLLYQFVSFPSDKTQDKRLKEYRNIALVHLVSVSHVEQEDSTSGKSEKVPSVTSTQKCMRSSHNS